MTTKIEKNTDTLMLDSKVYESQSLDINKKTKIGFNILKEIREALSEQKELDKKLNEEFCAFNKVKEEENFDLVQKKFSSIQELRKKLQDKASWAEVQGRRHLQSYLPILGAYVSTQALQNLMEGKETDLVDEVNIREFMHENPQITEITQKNIADIKEINDNRTILCNEIVAISKNSQAKAQKCEEEFAKLNHKNNLLEFKRIKAIFNDLIAQCKSKHDNFSNSYEKMLVEYCTHGKKSIVKEQNLAYLAEYENLYTSASIALDQVRNIIQELTNEKSNDLKNVSNLQDSNNSVLEVAKLELQKLDQTLTRAKKQLNETKRLAKDKINFIPNECER